MKTLARLLYQNPHQLICATPDESVFDALSKLAKFEIGALPVLEGDRVVGMFSERDYARKVILHGKASRETQVREVMTSRVIYAVPEMTIDEGLALMTDKRIRHLPVMAEGKLVGLVSIGDLVKAKICEQEFIIEQLERYITR